MAPRASPLLPGSHRLPAQPCSLPSHHQCFPWQIRHAVSGGLSQRIQFPFLSRKCFTPSISLNSGCLLLVDDEYRSFPFRFFLLLLPPELDELELDELDELEELEEELESDEEDESFFLLLFLPFFCFFLSFFAFILAFFFSSLAAARAGRARA